MKSKQVTTRHCCWAIMLLLCFVSTAAATEYGGYAGAYLQLSVNARATGMGNAFTAVSDDVTGLFFNPGAAAQLQRFCFGGAYRDLSFDRSLQQLAVIFPVRGEAAIGISAEFASMSGIEGRTALGDSTGTLDNLDAVMSITFSRRFSHLLSLGGNARYYYKKLESTSAYSVGFDVGALLHLAKRSYWADNVPQLVRKSGLPKEFPADLLRFGIAVKNISAKYPWNTGDYWLLQKSGTYNGYSGEDKVPLAVVVGASALGLKRRLLLAVDVEKTENKNVKLYVGSEFHLLRNVDLRAGLSQGRPACGIGFLAVISGIDMRIDIAVEQAQNVGGWETIIGSTWQF